MVAGLVGLVALSRWWAGEAPPVDVTAPAEPIPSLVEPHAVFDGGHRYATEQERAADASTSERRGEGLLMALVDALRARGITATNPIEPEHYGYMTVVEIDGEDVILQLAAGGPQEWRLWVKAPSGRVPPSVVDALHALEDIRNVRWHPS